MARKDPSFWWRGSSLGAVVLGPLGWLYGLVAAHNMHHRTPPKINLPVLCIGNFTLGGAGKTPLVIALAEAAKARGLKPGIVARGHGGKKRLPYLVDRERDSARDVGDEALLLGAHAPTVVAIDRHLAAQKLTQLGCDIILMDDGFQSRRLKADYALMVVDAMRGIGNGKVFPSGPLRAPLKSQMLLTDGLLMIGQDEQGQTERLIRMAARAAKPIDRAKLIPSSRHKIKGKKFLAFAGIGNPAKFFASLEEMGGRIVKKRVFADHHFFRSYELESMAEEVKAQKLWLATTAKDAVRFQADHKPKRLVVVDVALSFDDPHFPARILRQTLDNFRKRRG